MVSRFLSPQNLLFRERFALEGSREQTELGFDERDTISRIGCNINKCKGELKGFFVFSKKKTPQLVYVIMAFRAVSSVDLLCWNC